MGLMALVYFVAGEERLPIDMQAVIARWENTAIFS